MLLISFPYINHNDSSALIQKLTFFRFENSVIKAKIPFSVSARREPVLRREKTTAKIKSKKPEIIIGVL
jgi:hypothetical protein